MVKRWRDGGVTAAPEVVDAADGEVLEDVEHLGRLREEEHLPTVSNGT